MVGAGLKDEDGRTWVCQLNTAGIWQDTMARGVIYQQEGKKEMELSPRKEKIDACADIARKISWPDQNN